MSEIIPGQTHADSYILRATAASGTLRIVGIEGQKIVETARRRHGLSKTATAALGRALLGSLLLAVVLGKRTDSRVNLKLAGGGPVGWLMVEGSVSGDVRGYVRHPEADLPIRSSDGKLDVGGLVGCEGEIEVTRLIEGGEPYTGSVSLVSGEVAEDIASYLGVSEQIPNAVLLGVYEEEGQVSQAGGLLVQAMPDASNKTLAQLEANIAKLGTLTDRLRSGGLLSAMEQVAEDMDLQLAAEAQAARFSCRCSRQKALDSLRFFSVAERLEMYHEGGQEVVCHWCGEKYMISPQELLELNDNLGGSQRAEA